MENFTGYTLDAVRRWALDNIIFHPGINETGYTLDAVRRWARESPLDFIHDFYLWLHLRCRKALSTINAVSISLGIDTGYTLDAVRRWAPSGDNRELFALSAGYTLDAVRRWAR